MVRTETHEFANTRNKGGKKKEQLRVLLSYGNVNRFSEKRSRKNSFFWFCFVWICFALTMYRGFCLFGSPDPIVLTVLAALTPA